MSGVFVVAAARRDAANAAVSEPMFGVAYPSENPTHYYAGWATIPQKLREAIVAVGAVEFDDLDTALESLGKPRALSVDERLAQLEAENVALKAKLQQKAVLTKADIDEVSAAQPVRAAEVEDVVASLS